MQMYNYLAGDRKRGRNATPAVFKGLRRFDWKIVQGQVTKPARAQNPGR